ncbi:uncharacterized protein PFL1_05689 [Pseudozyma flocculosa PF-1]|uniref:Related to potassium transporter TRK-1 n=2 Tax=Pseudozyma flocculosa TaxID=84751 RepID=A0A5C3FC42_9BASI|nr:uncharacterized protein PFL1_05689 [Pseudozyma flocculosa PF-1]EPQ26710.1 hypothetical protein PFL1_05689 [Pseudozyma flocculosa PF-1]SPO40969.1 related to potassium transporter TRK-1 [Pseudozyma flocculosa]
MRRPELPERLQPMRARYRDALKWCGGHLNFFRVHVLVFTFTPLFAACIFYAANTAVHIPFIDALFVCTSAMTVTGLVTIDISTANPGQQAIMFILMCIGNLSAVSVTMVWIRRHFFRARFDHVIRTSAKARKRAHDVEVQEQREKKLNRLKLQRMMGLKPTESAESSEENGGQSGTSASSSSDHIDVHAPQPSKKKQGKPGKRQPLRADMIRRIDGPAFLINSAGVASTAVPEPRSKRRSGSGSRASGSQDEAQAFSLPPSGGILNSEPASDEHPSDRATAQQQQPSIRISLPPTQPAGVSMSDTLGGDVALAESPQQDLSAFRQGSGSTPRRGSLPRFHETAQDADGQDQDVAVADDEFNNAPRSAGPVRTRFDDGADDDDGPPRTRARRVSDPPQSRFRRGSDTGLLNVHATERHEPFFPRAQTVEFAEPHEFRSTRGDGGVGYTTGYAGHGLSSVRSRGGTRDLDRTTTMRSGVSQVSGRSRAGPPLTRTMTSSKQRGFGGFPTPIEIAGMAFKKALPKVQDRLNRTMTMPRTSTFTSVHSTGASAMALDGSTKPAPYLSFDATVSGNSMFHELTEAQRDELGGVEYRAIDLLAKLIPAYWLLLNFFFITLVAPYVSSRAFRDRYDSAFISQGVNKPNYTWFWFFQVVSAYTNTGFSLIDTSMTTMQDAYFLLIPMGFLILAGNTAFPIVLRFFIWCISKVVPKRSRVSETLQFLLDHPRRCFVYLFPSSQTWFLLFVLAAFNITDWIAFLVLDIGNPVIQSIPLGTRVFDGLFQSIAVRAAGFQVVSLLTLAPAVQFLYVVMMYLSAFPLALSVRSTNVYEEKSLGVYTQEPVGPTALPDQNNAKVWGSFLASHARKQLAFDIWWLGFALWLICIVERRNIEDSSTNYWFTVFSCMFELTSAYGTVGLSTGTPDDSFSLSGRFSTLSKLIVIAVMIRGRHRGLPVAIDRAVLLPSDVEIEDEVMSQYPIDEEWERESTFVRGNGDDADGTAAAAGVESDSVVGSMGANSNAGPGSGGVEPRASFSNIRRTMSGVSFADQTPRAGGAGSKRGSFGSDSLMLPSSPKSQNTYYEGRSSSFAGGGVGGSMAAPPGLSAIREVSGAATPTSESRPPSVDLERSFALPPSYQATQPTSKASPDGAVEEEAENRASSAGGSSSHESGGSAKGKERQRGGDGGEERHELQSLGARGGKDEE